MPGLSSPRVIAVTTCLLAVCLHGALSAADKWRTMAEYFHPRNSPPPYRASHFALLAAAAEADSDPHRRHSASSEAASAEAEDGDDAGETVAKERRDKGGWLPGRLLTEVRQLVARRSPPVARRPPLVARRRAAVAKREQPTEVTFGWEGNREHMRPFCRKICRFCREEVMLKVAALCEIQCVRGTEADYFMGCLSLWQDIFLSR